MKTFFVIDWKRRIVKEFQASSIKEAAKVFWSRGYANHPFGEYRLAGGIQ